MAVAAQTGKGNHGEFNTGQCMCVCMCAWVCVELTLARDDLAHRASAIACADGSLWQIGIAAAYVVSGKDLQCKTRWAHTGIAR